MLLIGLVSIYTMNTINQGWIQTFDTTRGRQRVWLEDPACFIEDAEPDGAVTKQSLLRVQVARYVSNSSCTCSGRHLRDHLLPCHLNWDQINLLFQSTKNFNCKYWATKVKGKLMSSLLKLSTTSYYFWRICLPWKPRSSAWHSRTTIINSNHGLQLPIHLMYCWIPKTLI
jgi:hypothetical protein